MSLSVSTVRCCQCIVFVASRVFVFLPRTLLLLCSLSGSRDLCKGYQSMKVCVCERAQVTHALCQVLVEYCCQLFLHPAITHQSSPKPHFHCRYLTFISHLQSPSLCSVRQNRPYQCLNQSRFQCDWDGPILPQLGISTLQPFVFFIA